MSASSHSIGKSHERATEQLRQRWVLGIDLGGTTIKFGLFHGDHLIWRNHIRTEEFDSLESAFEACRQSVEETLRTSSKELTDLSAIGLAMAGVLDPKEEALAETANLHRWHHLNFRQQLTNVFEKPVAVLNDADAAALAESVHGLCRAESLVLLTLGTGVGGGVIVNGRPLRGANGCGGEIGHATIQFDQDARLCGCGFPGHLEAYAGSAGVVQTANELMQSSRDESSLNSAKRLTPLAIANAAALGDRVATQTIDQTAIYIGRAISMLAHVLDPEVVLLGGAMNFGGPGTDIGKRFIEGVRVECLPRSLTQISRNLQIEFATLGNDAGIVGAAHFAQQLAEQEGSDSIR
ncbi:ROK family protein [Rhodopirellula halodulae]|uniref:ROK family protein n=1 Tax=Rhodopirellula halodulae TaxID=2894198 RepID=UPI001E513704|nr:ROK family protein [Rhodopirellula sp. JC737]MCC9658655.1 ROK family protein [Rhodopirellula sp. JC737]